MQKTKRGSVPVLEEESKMERVQAGFGDGAEKTAERIIKMVASEEVPAHILTDLLKDNPSWNKLISDLESLIWEEPPSMVGLGAMVQQLIDLHHRVDRLMNYWPNRLSKAQTIAENMTRIVEDLSAETKEKTLAKIKVKIGWTTLSAIPKVPEKLTGELSEQHLKKLKEIVALSRLQLVRARNTSQK
jgi:uncharacterized membrane protein YheB (UPF0754 family)